jgi:two-component system CheB/CheR fusion protein
MKKRQAAAPLSLESALPAAAGLFPVVGIGASAGGLEALDTFLKNVPVGSGMAWVIVQHLDPTCDSLMAELLQRGTAMKVSEVVDCTRVQPDCVYVIPPNKDLSILHGVLHLLEPVQPRGLRLPIDGFFRALAADMEERAVGVVLSGMGSDGTLGLQAIQEKAGLTAVQDPATAQHNGMPRSAVLAGVADIVASVAELPEKIQSYLRHLPRIAAPHVRAADQDSGSFDKVLVLLRTHTGHDFSCYKQNTVARRIERRMGIHQIEKMPVYVRFLQENPQELELLFRELLIGVTRFFRDPEVWEQVQAEVIPALLLDRPPGRPLRIWVPGCATGEEAYSLAIAFRESLEQLQPDGHHTVQIFATDLDAQAIEKARAGLFPPHIVADVSAERLQRFFVQVDDHYQITKAIRDMVVFAPQNVIMDPPFTRLDLVSCRNLLIYLMPEMQQKLLPLFHFSLSPGGFLLLGNSETIGGLTTLFAPLVGKSRLYRRLATAPWDEPGKFPPAFAPVLLGVPALPQPMSLPVNVQAEAEKLLLQLYAPAAVLVNDKGDIIFISGRTGKYLEPAAGKVNWNLFAMVRAGLGDVLIETFHKALREQATVTRRNAQVEANDGQLTVDLTVHVISDPEILRGLILIVFADVATLPPSRRPAGPHTSASLRVGELEREQKQIYQELLASRAEIQSSREYAVCASEELHATNEDLQSTNEELQSLNEELQTVNAIQLAKVDALARTNNDMKNLLDNSEVSTVFLDAALRVRMFTAGANRVFKLIPGDVGRPITDIVSILDYPALADDMRAMLRDLTVHEQSVATNDGRWFRVRILPYRTTENMIDGVILTMVDTTAEHSLADQARRETNDLLRLAVVVRDSCDAVTVQDLEGRIIAWNPGAVRLYGWSETEALAMNVHERIPPGKQQAALAQLHQLSQASTLDPYQTERLAKDGTSVEVSITSSALINQDGRIYAIATNERATGRAGENLL